MIAGKGGPWKKLRASGFQCRAQELREGFHLHSPAKHHNGLGRPLEPKDFGPWLILTSWFCSVQFRSVIQSCPTLCDPMDCSTSGLPVHCQLWEFTQTHVHWVGDAIQPSHPLLSLSPPALNISQHQGLFKWVSSSHQWSKYWSFHFSISPSNEYSGPVSFRMDWFDLLAVQGTLKSLLQHHSSKASILRAQLSL